jgi:glycosyltransferase involved in cell wall biosynthesis
LRSAIVIPTYNERENIGLLVDKILALPAEIQVIVVDDNSPDGTGDFLSEQAARWPALRLIRRPRKMGLGTAHIAGFRLALTLDVDCILTMDADFSHHPRYVPDLIAAAEKWDIVIGSRYVKGGGTVNCGLNRTLLSRAANAFARLMLGLEAYDCTAGFRCYRRRVLEAAPLDDIFSNGYSFLIEMLYRCQRLGFKVSEVPICFENRQRGNSKISRAEILRAAYTVLRLAPNRVLGRPVASQVPHF